MKRTLFLFRESPLACGLAAVVPVFSMIALAADLSGPQCPYICDPDQKLCGNRCVSMMDRRFGCGARDCRACSLPNAIATCDAAESCAIAACKPGWADCDGNPANGCEADLSRATTCGSCGTSCSGDTPFCGPTGCVAACDPPLTQCGSSCVSVASSPLHCGSCTRQCEAADDGFPTCSLGGCGDPDCPAGQILCQGRCVDTETDPGNCGECGHHCPPPLYSYGAAECAAGSCSVACPPGQTYCGSTSSTCELLDSDPQNCGVCGNVCASDEVCTFGSCTSLGTVWLTTGLSNPEDIAVDETTVYWTSPSDNLIQSIDKHGGTVFNLASSLVRPRHLTLDDQYVYWSDDLGAAIMRTLKDGSGAPEIVTAAITPVSIVVDSTSVYWTTELRIMSAPKSGGVSTTFAQIPAMYSQSIADIISDGETLFAMETFVSGSAGVVWRVDLRDGSVRVFPSYGSAVRQSIMAVDSARFYETAGEIHQFVQWVNKSDGRDRGTFSTFYVRPTFISPTDCDILWTDGTHVYLSIRGLITPDYWRLFAVPVNRMAFDGSNLYWTSQNAVGRIPAL